MNNNKGFTLIELLVAVTIFAILVAIGVPQINDISNRNRMVAEINLITGAVNLARSESVKRGRIVTLCASTSPGGTGAICNTDNWESGWVIFMDENKNAEFDSATDVKIKIGGEITAGNTLRLFESDDAGQLQYKPDGSLRDQGTDGFDDGTFVMCDRNAAVANAKAVNINRLGRTGRAVDGSDAGTVIEDVNGDDLTTCT